MSSVNISDDGEGGSAAHANRASANQSGADLFHQQVQTTTIATSQHIDELNIATNQTGGLQSWPSQARGAADCSACKQQEEIFATKGDKRPAFVAVAEEERLQKRTDSLAVDLNASSQQQQQLGCNRSQAQRSSEEILWNALGPPEHTVVSACSSVEFGQPNLQVHESYQNWRQQAYKLDSGHKQYEQKQEQRQETKRSPRRRLLSSGSSQLSSYLKNVAQKCRENWSSEFWSVQKVEKNMKHRYVMFLFLFSLFLIACLLATLVISRNVGQLDQEESAKSNERLKMTANEQQLEVRQLELVDLIECDKTFAYTRWRLQVRVPKSEPAYVQRNRFAPAEVVAATAVSAKSEPSAALLQLAESRAPPSSLAHEEELFQDGSESNESFYFTGTSEFVEEANGALQPTDAALSIKKQQASDSLDEQESQQDDENERNRRTSSRKSRGAELNLTREATGFDPLDPRQFATSEMKLSLANRDQVNSTLIDCFVVDIEKRHDQKQSIEAKHKQLARVRRVDFAKMLSIIQECRQLTWSTLGVLQPKLRGPTGGVGGLVNGHQSSATTPPPPPLQLVSSAVTARDLLKAPPGTPLQVPIVPVERPVTPSAVNEDPFATLFGMLASWGQPGNESTTTTTMRPKAPDRQRRQARVVDTSRLLPTGQAPATANEDDEARRASYLNMGMSMISGIVPNTLWCGLGDRAANYSELGAEYQVDSCCRAHDHCPIRLKPFTADYGLINWSMSTRSHCDCDLDFNDCLVRVNTSLSSVIRTLYFRFIGLQCIDIANKRARNEAQLMAGQ